MDIREVLARNLRKYRQLKGLSQEALAGAAGVDRTYISALERGVHSATITMVDKLATVMGVEAAALLERPSKSARAKPNR
jgi:transcriptional regulator with XRE-family HTH domain